MAGKGLVWWFGYSLAQSTALTRGVAPDAACDKLFISALKTRYVNGTNCRTRPRTVASSSGAFSFLFFRITRTKPDQRIWPVTSLRGAHTKFQKRTNRLTFCYWLNNTPRKCKGQTMSHSLARYRTGRQKRAAATSKAKKRLAGKE